MLNKDLWNKINRFDFDTPPSEYGFSTRLASENYWTKEFTAQALVEYKKFMYLAAISDTMVSPSEIVDVVWHQHLVFTQSYQAFCHLLGKQIQHIPSTHNREDAAKFKRAKEHTTRLYRDCFGEQPTAIWNYGTMYENLHMERTPTELETLIVIAIGAFAILTIPAFFFLKPVYAATSSPLFFLLFCSLVGVVFATLEMFNLLQLQSILRLIHKGSFLYELQPLELVYLQTQKLSYVIHGTVNELIANQTIKIHKDNGISIDKNQEPTSPEQFQAITTLKALGKVAYPALLNALTAKPIFVNTKESMDALRKHINHSRQFHRILHINCAVLGLVFMVGFMRVAIGIARDKPVTYILLAVMFLGVAIAYYLRRLTRLFCTRTIPMLYKNTILPQKDVKNNWQWSYFLLGVDALSAPFLPIVELVNKNTSSGMDYSSSCGSSSSSCGGGCGGCGGD